KLEEKVLRILDQLELNGKVGLRYKVKLILNNWSMEEKQQEKWDFSDLFDENAISDILLENLKAATPWIVKAVNIEYLFMRESTGGNVSALQLATQDRKSGVEGTSGVEGGVRS